MKNEYIEIIFRERSQSGKTCIWEVVSKSSGNGLGLIKWYGAWRQYTFHPYEGTVWNDDCLGEVVKFLDKENDIHAALRGRNYELARGN